MGTPRQIAALYVEPAGCYIGQPGIDPWDEARDARQYAGPHPVVAHPPCQRWGPCWPLSPGAPIRCSRGCTLNAPGPIAKRLTVSQDTHIDNTPESTTC